MKVRTTTSVFFLAPIILALSTLVLADDGLILRKHLSQSEWPESINTLVVTLYDSEHADLPLASQAYVAGEWNVAEMGESTVVTVTFDDLNAPGSHEEIWMELEADGRLLSQRSQAAAAATSGVTFALGNVLDMDGNPITNVDDPVDSQDAATKAYVDTAVGAISGGDITAVAAGTGLIGGGDTGDVTLTANTTYLQRRVSSSCATGSSIREIDATGAVACETDNTGIITEADPQVGANTNNHVPVWNGSALMTGTIVDQTVTGFVGIGINNPYNTLHLLEDKMSLSYPLKLDNPHGGIGFTAVGLLFSTEGDAGAVAPARGKGAIVYKSTGAWNRGSFLFLQDSAANADIPELGDAVMTITNNGAVGIGTTDPQAKLDVQDVVRVRGNTWPATGTGGSLELAYNSAENLGYVQVQDRDTDEYGELHLAAATITHPMRQGILRIPPAAFQQTDGGWDVLVSEDQNEAVCNFLLECNGAAAVYLPDGATVTRLVGYVLDNNSLFNPSVKLYWDNPYSAAGDQMALARTSGASPNRRTGEDSTIIDPTVVLSARHYYLTVYLLPGMKFYGAKIEYEYTRVGH